MAKIARTVNPIHFEDLEPRRFEDLVRQLLYGFRPWKSVEPLGRTGADDGYDVRLMEDVSSVEADNEEGETEDTPTLSEESVWQVQCKREKSITASKISFYIEECFKTGIPYGFIFVAACEFSKKTRDTFNLLMREKGVKEFFLWGKADLEDMVFMPENDHLLFAYFGFSLGIEKRKKQNTIKRIISVKRKLVKITGGLQDHCYRGILLKDINDKDYPYIKNKKEFEKKKPWKIYYCLGHYHDGIILLVRKYYAYFDREKEEYDVIKENNLALSHDDFWNNREKIDDYPIYMVWSKTPKDNQAYYEMRLHIPYISILEIDEIGDSILKIPILYINHLEPGIFSKGEEVIAKISSYSYPEIIPLYTLKKLKKIKYYPEKFPTREEIEKENTKTNLKM